MREWTRPNSLLTSTHMMTCVHTYTHTIDKCDKIHKYVEMYFCLSSSALTVASKHREVETVMDWQQPCRLCCGQGWAERGRASGTHKHRLPGEFSTSEMQPQKEAQHQRLGAGAHTPTRKLQVMSPNPSLSPSSPSPPLGSHLAFYSKVTFSSRPSCAHLAILFLSSFCFLRL